MNRETWDYTEVAEIINTIGNSIYRDDEFTEKIIFFEFKKMLNICESVIQARRIPINSINDWPGNIERGIVELNPVGDFQKVIENKKG